MCNARAPRGRLVLRRVLWKMAKSLVVVVGRDGASLRTSAGYYLS